MAKTSKGVFFLPPSDAYVRSFPYPFYTSVKLYCTKALSDQASSLAPDWILLFWRPRIPESFLGSATTFHLGGSSWIVQDKVRMLGALVLCSPSKHIFCCTLLTLWCACVNEWNTLHEASEEPCSAVLHNLIGLWQKLVESLYRPANAERQPMSPLGDWPKMGKACGLNSPFSVKLFGLFDHFITPQELEGLT